MARKKDAQENPKTAIENASPRDGEVLMSAATFAAAAADDRDAPRVDILSPAPGTVFRGEGVVTVPVRVGAEDNQPNLKLVEWFVDGQRDFREYPPGKRGIEDGSSFQVLTHDHPVEHLIRARAFDHAYNERWASPVTIIVEGVYVPPVDTLPPTYEIISPREGARIGSKDGKATIRFQGTASDPSGVKSVEWSRDGGASWQPANTTNVWANWWVDLSVSDYGAYAVAFRFTDNKGFNTTAVRRVEVAKPIKYDNINDLVNPHEYLKDLAKYAGPHVTTPGGALNLDMLKTVFFQPFSELVNLVDPLVAPANQPVSQVRLGIEVLRSYLATQREPSAATQALNQPAGMRALAARAMTAEGQAALATASVATMAAADIATGLVAYWKFDEGSGAIAADASGNNNVGDLVGWPTWISGKLGKALSFRDNYVAARTPAQFAMTNAFSICAWLYPQDEGSSELDGGMIFEKAGEYSLVRFPGGTLKWTMANAPVWNNSGGNAPVQQWTHLALVYGNAKVTMYINGQKLPEGAAPASVGSFDPNFHQVRVGANRDVNANFHGIIDEMRIYRRALSAEDVTAIFTGVVATPPKLLAHWKFDEKTGTTAADATGNGNVGNLVGGPLWTSPGRIDGGLSFDGKDDYVQVTTPSNLKMSKAVSICAWIKPQGPGSHVPNGGIIFCKEAEYFLVRLADGTIAWAFAKSNGQWEYVATSYLAPLDKWTHLALTYDDGIVKTYADGREVHRHSGSGAIGSTAPAVNDVRIGGRRDYVQHFHGLMDDVRVYNYALSADEVKAFFIPPVELAAHWRLNERAGVTAADATKKGSNGTLDGPAWTAGRFASGLSFDGVNDRVTLPDATPLKQITNNFTLMFWAKPRATHEVDAENQTGTGGLSGQRFALAPQQGATVYGSADHAGAGISVGMNGVSVYEHSQNHAPALLVYAQPISGWTHIAVIYKDKQPRLYLNGKLVKTGLVSTKSFVHACPASLGGMTGGFYRGQIDEVRIYNQALPEEDLARLLADYQFSMAEAEYLLAAYQALLNQIGTTYEKLRLSRSADDETRRRLAEELGIAPENLNDLFLLPELITEEELEKRFGFMATNLVALRAIATPDLQKWRIANLRNRWKEQDAPNDSFTQHLLPSIDPDLIGPEDLRSPVAGQAPFDLWKTRRDWVDARLQEFAGKTKKVNDETVPDLAAMFTRMYQEVSYANAKVTAWKNTQPAEFDKLRNDLQNSELEIRELAADKIKRELNLDPEGFVRLLFIRDKDQVAGSDSRNEKVREEEWQEAYAMLTQAQKTACLPAWIAEEQTRQIFFGPQSLWISLREPKEGQWPPVVAPGHPFIDPDKIKPEDLPDPPVGAKARALWEARRLRLVELKKALQTERETKSFEAMLKLALGHPKSGDPLQYDLAALNSDLNNNLDPQIVESAKKKITGDLLLTVEAFNRLMAVKVKDAQTDPLKKPTTAEYAEIYALLLPARKVKHEYPAWKAEEESAGLLYWTSLKARLPRWRASLQARQEWQRALRGRSEPPIVDPDVIGKNDVRNDIAGNLAFDLLEKRTSVLTAAFEKLKSQRETQEKALAGFDQIVVATLNKPIDDLSELSKRDKKGEDLTAVFNQLHLTKEAFRYLMRMRGLAASPDEVLTETEWANVYHILVQVQKSRDLFAGWQDEEAQKQLALTSEHFRIPDYSETDKVLVPWRATELRRQDWQDTLQARIDQEKTVADGLLAAVTAVEDQTLPMLRSALVRLLSALQGKDEVTTIEWINAQLAIDVRVSGFQKTTRLVQAVETILSVLFSLRIGRFVKGHPADAWKLSVDETHFDAEWKWLGTHSAWASALLAFYYPDMLLIPNLYRPQTAPFAALIKNLRTNTQLTPEKARQEARAYAAAVQSSLPASISGNLGLFNTEQLAPTQVALRRDLIRGAFGGITNPHVLPDVQKELFFFVPLQLAIKLQQAGEYIAALGWFKILYAYDLANKLDTAIDERKIYYGLELERNIAPGIIERGPHWLQGELDPHALAKNRPNAYTRYTLLSLVRCFLDYGDAEFTRDTFESLAQARLLYENARQLLMLPELQPPPPDPASDQIPPNPVQDLLLLRVETQLTKLREGRNIAGMKRQIDLLASSSALRFMPIIGSDGQLIIPGLRPTLRPTPYRFAVLLERSKQLVNTAQQIEAAFLAALEKKDAENYNLLKAGHDLQLAQAQAELQSKRIQEANLGVRLAQAQRQRAVVVQQKYTELSNKELNSFEKQMVDHYNEAIGNIQKAGAASALAAKLKGAAALATSLASYFHAVGAAKGSWIGGLTPVWNAPAAIAYIAAAGLSQAAGASQFKAGLQEGYAASYSANAQVAQTMASIAGIYASHEWRKEEWKLQAEIAAEDVAIGNAQVAVAQAQVEVVEQERRIAQTQITQAQATATFLASKFTNAELYEWMSGILGDVYRYFLQQATAMAQLAENQLWFERQDTPPRLIQANYWQTPSENGQAGSGDRRGLTGSARLLQDITQLDQYAFRNDKRKLNLSQTFSLARMSPYDFEQFRETGVLTFSTPTSLFDRDFPGHYLRLIKRARVSVVALIPPHHGIRATLTASGVSRTVIGGDVFQEVVIRRDPELVALTSPVSSTGVFELDPQPEMLLPFESMGVDTFWQLEMPKAANPFDFRTIADVLVTLEYTALNSFDYRAQVLKKLNPKLSGERSFSFRGEFSDGWYDLHNPEQSATSMAVKFKIEREDFPPNLDNLKIEHVLLFFSRADESFEVEIKHLRFTPKGETHGFGGGTTTVDGAASTRRGNGSAWLDMIGQSPAGEWELALLDTPMAREWFKDGKINDILLVITYGGRTPAWPG